MPLKVGTALPGLGDATCWLNYPGTADDLAETANQTLTIIHFWAKSCPACKINMPHLQTVRDRYASRGLETIAVHMPRGDFDLDIDEVKSAVSQLGIREPCAIDNGHKIGDRFDVKAWPTYYLFDKKGFLKRHAAGGLGVKMVEAALKDVFGE